MPLDEALRDFAERIPLLDARFFVTAVLMQRETGGNLAEVLDNLGKVIRERFQVKRQVRVLTAHGRITGWILAGFPPALACAMFVINPDHLGHHGGGPARHPDDRGCHHAPDQIIGTSPGESPAASASSSTSSTSGRSDDLGCEPRAPRSHERGKVSC